MPESFEKHFAKKEEEKSPEKIKEEKGLALAREIKEIEEIFSVRDRRPRGPVYAEVHASRGGNDQRQPVHHPRRRAVIRSVRVHRPGGGQAERAIEEIQGTPGAQPPA